MDDEFLRDQQTTTERNRTPPPRLWSVESSEATPRAKLASRNTTEVPKEHQMVCNIVTQCLELGKEDVDLS